MKCKISQQIASWVCRGEQNIVGFSITFPFLSSGFTHNLSLTLSELYHNILWFYYLLDLVLIG